MKFIHFEDINLINTDSNLINTDSVNKLPQQAQPKELKAEKAKGSGMGLQDESLPPGKSLDYYKDLM